MNALIEPADDEPEIGLDQWYSEQVDFQRDHVKNHAKYLFGGLKFYKWYNIVVLVLIILQVLFMFMDYAQDYQPGSSDQFFQDNGPRLTQLYCLLFGLLVNSSISWFVYTECLKKINSFRKMIADGAIFPFGENKIINIREAVKDLCGRMGINFKFVRFWGILNADKFPSIEEDPDTGCADILIPTNFIVYFETNRDEGVAVLAHELGHVLQKDTDIYVKTEAYFEVVRKIFLPLTILNGLGHLALFFWVHSLDDHPILELFLLSLLAFDGLVINYLYTGFDKLRETHRNSEKLADAAAVIYANGFDLINVLNAFDNIEATPSAIHPNKEERISHINMFYPNEDEEDQPL
ncbi:MAG: M48 family metalloprotease [Bacteroidota bacterium]|nr:M48 family metalloprotease [Bacteroidota bacterium]